MSLLREDDTRATEVASDDAAEPDSTIEPACITYLSVGAAIADQCCNGTGTF
jgi:hypothetical protein